MICYLFPEPTYLFFSSDIPRLLYYSHIPTTVIALLVGIFVFWHGRQFLLNRLLLGISILFSLWTLSTLIQWTNIHSDFIMLSWSLLNIILGLIAILCIYFVYVFLAKKDVSTKVKGIFFALLAPIIALSPTSFNISGFDITNCDAFSFEWLPFKIYANLLGIVAIIWILFLLIRYYRIASESLKKEIVLLGIGIELFLFVFFVCIFTANYLTQLGILADSSFEMYGLLGVVILMVYISIIIVRFKAFDVKLLGAQALVWALIILIGSEFFFVENLVNQMLVGITLVLSAVVGLIIVRDVKKEIAQKEHIEKIAGELKIANNGQENLIHIMNHQVKGFFGIARNIFAELLEGDDYGKMPDKSKPLLEKGLESTSTGVDYVQEILRGFNAEKGLLSFESKPINIKDIVLKLLYEQKDIAVKKGLKFESNIEDGEYNINGDGSQLREAFKNLITNGIKYNDYTYPERGIIVNLSSKDKRITFSVKDTGIGISEEDKPNLFKAGGMGKNSLKFNADSSGFGLSTVKGIVEAHKGIVGYKPNLPEKGTTFFIEIPIS